MAAAIIASFLLFSALVLPQWEECTKSRGKVAREEAALKDLKDRIRQMSELPKEDFHLDSKSDAMLALKFLAEEREYKLGDINETREGSSSYIGFSLAASPYRSLEDVVTFLEQLRGGLAIAYTGYELRNNQVIAQGRLYFKQ